MVAWITAQQQQQQKSNNLLEPGCCLACPHHRASCPHDVVLQKKIQDLEQQLALEQAWHKR